MATRFSHSRLGTYRACPRKYAYQYIERKPKVRKLAANMEMGRIVHDVLRKLYEVGSFDRLTPLEDALAQYDAAWEKLAGAPVEVTSESMTVDDYIHAGRKMLTRFYEKNQPFNEGTLIGVEAIINFTLPGTLIPMQVKVDRLWKRPDGVVEIVDYKTGRYLPRGGRDDKFFDQMGLYQLGVQTTWPQYERIELVQPFLALDETIRHAAEPEEIDLLNERVRSTVMEIRNSERLEDFPTIENSQCNFCDYYELCPAKRHERLLSKEEEIGSTDEATPHSASLMAAEYIKLDIEAKRIKAKMEALKEDLKLVTEELDLTRLVCDEGEVTIKPKTEEKFITKTSDPDGYSQLNFLARQFGLDDYMVIDANALMKEVYVKRKLPEEQLAELEKYVRIKKSATVRVKPKSDEEESD